MREKLTALEQQFDECMLGDRGRFRRRLGGLYKRLKAGKPLERGYQALSADVAASQARLAARRAALPRIDYPPQLPVSDKRAAIAAAIEAHQVVIVAGETGSGKTTQLPKICLELGRGVAGLIGHTQPRRLAARSVAGRIAEELGSPLGQAVGYKVRFTDRTGERSHIKLMTDGILLAEIQRDRLLSDYDTLIIDEAHERSLNIDFLLGFLHQLLPKRPDLKLLITSATINTESFSRFFGDAPVVEVSGRTYPVDVYYRPLTAVDEDDRDRDLPEAIIDAVDEAASIDPLGDILVFLPGEREIREAAHLLERHRMRDTEVIPLYSRLSAAEQDRVFKPHAGRRIVLSTNVAETSLTVPGIRFVIDSGLARISRYSPRTKVQRLPVEAISQASANQRAGRCGRVSAGICFRLYDEEDFTTRPEYTDPEIRRTNLAAVILQMEVLRLGHVEGFPFLTPPDPRQVTDGYRLLHELGAVDARHRLTDIGRQLARLPVDPRIARMLLAAGRENCLDEVLVIAAGLSVQDPRERPHEAQTQADQAHVRFRDERSDFVGLLKLWEHYHEQARHLSRNKLRKLCKKEYLSFVRMREWHDIHGQLKQLAHELGLSHNREPAEYASLHRALLTGLLGNIAVKEEAGKKRPSGKGGRRTDPNRYLGARNVKLSIFPGSGLFKQTPKWIVASELVETTRLYARGVASIDPRWLEPLALHLVKRTYLEPHWEKRAGQVAAFEQVSLYGLVIVPRRKVNYGPVDPALSRELFIRHALVRGELRGEPPFLRHNRELTEEVELLEAKSRRRDVLVDEQTLFEFYDQRVPEGIYSGKAFDKWRRNVEREEPRRLFLTREALMQHEAGAITAARFPDQLEVAGMALPLAYHFEPGHPADGVTVTVPLVALGNLPPGRFEWLVPGLLEEKIIALIKSLPKALRRNFVPAVNFAQAALEALHPVDRPLTEVLAEQLERMTGVPVPTDSWRPEMVPVHLQMNFRLLDAEGKVLAEGRDLMALQGRWAEQARETLSERPVGGIERDALQEWDFDELPESVEVTEQGVTMRAYPALVDEGDHVALRVFEAPHAAEARLRAGVRRLFLLGIADKVKYLRRNLPDIQRMCLQFAGIGRCEGLKEDILLAGADRAFFGADPPPRTRERFSAQAEAGWRRFGEEVNAVAAIVGETLAYYHKLARATRGSLAPHRLQAVADIDEQLRRLIYPGFVTATPPAWLPRLPRYLEAALKRLEKLDADPQRDRKLQQQMAPLWQGFWERWDGYDAHRPPEPEMIELRWLLEELRISLFAQELKTVQTVSVPRLQRRLRELSAA